MESYDSFYLSGWLTNCHYVSQIVFFFARSFNTIENQYTDGQERTAVSSNTVEKENGPTPTRRGLKAFLRVAATRKWLNL